MSDIQVSINPVANLQVTLNASTNSGTAVWGNLLGNISDQADLQAALNTKVDKVTGKQLSTEDYTTAEKTKLAGIEAGAEVNNISDANATDLTDGGDTALHTHDSRYYTESEIDSTVATINTNLNNKVDVAGDTMTGSLTLQSSNAGGYNVSDSTRRLNLQSYQKAQYFADDGTTYAHFGEVLRIHLMDQNAKGMIAWLDSWTDPANPRTKAWIGYHYAANDVSDPINPHDHISIETPDSAGLLQSRFEVVATNADTTNIRVVNSDFVVAGSTNGVQNVDGQAKQFGIFTAGTGRAKSARWTIQGTSASETGSNVGTDFSIGRFADNGNFIAHALRIQRNNGWVGIGQDPAIPVARLEVTSSNDAPVFRAVNSTSSSSSQPNFQSRLGNVTNRAFESGLTSDTTARYIIQAGGQMEWGPGGSTARDTNLYRNAANELKTDDKLVVGLGLEVDSADNTFIVDATNNRVGIGTLTPAQALDVVGQVASTSFFRTNSGLTNNSSGNNATIRPQTGGTLIDRNVADGNPVLRVQNLNASSTGDILRLQDSSTNNLVTVDVTGQVTVNSRSSNRSINIVPQVNQGSSNVTGGALRVDNTNSTGLGMLLYTNAGSGRAARLFDINVANAAFDRAGFHVDYAGVASAFEISNTGTGTSNIALNVVSTNSDDSAVGINGSEASRGTVKIVHNKPAGSDAGASALSLRSNGVGTAAHAIFFDAEDGGTTGDLFLFRQNGVNVWRVDKDGILQVGSMVAARISDFAATVRSTVLTGLSTATNSAIAATDTVLQALGKLQAQIDNRLSLTGGTVSGAVTVAGSSNTVQSIVRGNSTQTSDLFQAQNSDSTVLTRITSTGKIGIGGTPGTSVGLQMGSGGNTDFFQMGDSFYLRGETGTCVVRGLIGNRTMAIRSTSNVTQRSFGFDTGLESVVEGTNKPMGLATLAAGTVTISNTLVTATSRIFLSRQTAGGTLGQLSVVLNAGVGFTINSNSASETSTVAWEIKQAI